MCFKKRMKEEEDMNMIISSGKGHDKVEGKERVEMR